MIREYSLLGLKQDNWKILTGQQAQQLEIFCFGLVAFHYPSAPTKLTCCRYLDHPKRVFLSSSENSGK